MISKKLSLVAGVLTSILLVQPTVVYAAVSSGEITSFSPICVGAATSFPAETNESDARLLTNNPNHAYGDLSQAPNPRWFYFKIKDSGTLNIAQTNSVPEDVDGALWGPFDDIPDMLRDGLLNVYPTSLLLASDYDAGPTFDFSASVVANKYYVLLVANFSGNATDISLDSGTGTTATTDCNMLNPGFDISIAGSNLDTTEAGATDAYEVNLYGQPTHDVTINLTTTNGEVAPDASSVVFGPDNWYIRQTVTVSAIDDLLLDGDQFDDIINTGASSDPDYNNLSRTISAVAHDNEVAPPTSVTITEDSNDDGVISGAELSGTVEASVVLPAGLSIGDVVSVTDGNGNTENVSLTSGNLSGPVVVSFAAPSDGGSITATASIIDTGGNVSGTVSDIATVDTTDPILTIAVDSVTADNTINAAEAGATLSITGTVAGEFYAADTVTLVVNSNAYTGVIDVAGVFSISIPGADLAADNTIVASVATTDEVGNTGSASITATYVVDTTNVPTITVDSVTTDNAINAAEAAVNVLITGTVAGDFNTGDIVTLVINGSSYTGVVDVAGTFGISVSGADLVSDTTIDASVMTTDAAGNTGTASITLTHTVDTTDPALTIAVDSVTADNTINAAEASANVTVTGTVGGEFKAGDNVTLTINSNAYVGVISATGVYSIDVAGADLGADITIEASIATTDAAGNTGSATATATYIVDTSDPILTIAVDSVTTGNAINAVEAAENVTVTGTVTGEFSVGDIVTLVVNGIIYTGGVNAAGVYSIEVVGADLVADTTIDASVSTTDAAGNTGIASIAPTHIVDITDPIPTIAVDSVTEDNEINSTEAGSNVTITGAVAGEYNAGDTVTLEINANTYTGVVDESGAYGIDVPGADLVADTTIDASVTTSDEAGNTGSASITSTHTVDTTNPVPTIAVDSVTTDNAINAVEAGENVTITGTVAGEYIESDTVTLVVNGNAHTGVVNAAGVYSIDVPGADLAADATVDASVATTDTAGNIGSATITATHAIDVNVLAPKIMITEDADNDGTINIAELNGSIDVAITLPADAVANDFITVTDGNTTKSIVLTAADIAAGNLVASFAAPADGETLTVTATLTDAARNVSLEDADSSTIDTTRAVMTAENIDPTADKSPTFSGTTDQADGHLVAVIDDNGNTLCSATVAAGSWSCESTIDLPYGVANLIAETSDLAGNTTITPFMAAIEIDSDNDGLVNSLDLDDDNDGIPDLVEDAGIADNDTDGDGIMDSQDLDSDNDGIFDIVEAGGEDTDANGLVDNATDTDGDGLADSVDVNPSTADTPIDAPSAAAISVLAITDSDGDGTPDFQDLDADNDGITDAIEGSADSDGDGLPNSIDQDSDEDGIPDILEGDADNDGDGIANFLDTDSDNDGIPDNVEENTLPPLLGVDSDNDGVDDALDVDVTSGTDGNGNGIDDAFEPIDSDGDGIQDFSDPDADNDGIFDEIEGTVDSDNDGIPDFLDIDSDNDGIADVLEGKTDTDTDGVPDYLDTDSDNDGLPDDLEDIASPRLVNSDADFDGTDDAIDVDNTGGTDSDNNGIDDAFEPTGSANGGVANHLNSLSDADNDGLIDAIEGAIDTDGDSTPDYLDTDSDADSIPDLVESNYQGQIPSDRDQDGVYDYVDVDSDNDGISDLLEGAADADGDLVPDFRDLDVDNDGIFDLIEARFGFIEVDTLDTDLNGVIDDSFDFGFNGMADVVETEPGSGIENYTLQDVDSDGVPDYQDIDSDNDGIFDSLESDHEDTDLDGHVDSPPAKAGFSSSDLFDDATVNATGLVAGAGGKPRNTDADGRADFRDVDSDNDGLSDAAESFGVDADANGDGRFDNFLDANSDGVSDSFLTAPKIAIDTDNDGVIDARELDSDGDGIADLVEVGGTDADNNGMVDNFSDIDGNGLDDGLDLLPLAIGDLDGDGMPNHRDLDSDGDGIFDVIESGGTDANGDGLADEPGLAAALIDRDNNGVADVHEISGGIRAGLSGRGCVIYYGDSPKDPMMLILLLLALITARVRSERTQSGDGR